MFEKNTYADEAYAPFDDPQIVDDFGTEEYVDAGGTGRPVALPVGHKTEYAPNLRDKLQRIPGLPGVAGRYTLRVTVTDGVPSYTWEVIS